MYGLLNISADPVLRDSRQKVLESGGYQVLSPLNMTEVEAACKHQHFAAVILGHMVPAPEKRRITATIRALCSPHTPVLGIYAESPEEVVEADLAVPAHQPQALLEGVRKLLKRTGSQRKGR